MEEVLVILFLVVAFALLVFLAIKVAKKDILMTRIASLLSVSWLLFIFIIEFEEYPEIIKLGLFPLLFFWGFAWITNAWIEKRGSNE